MERVRHDSVPPSAAPRVGAAARYEIAELISDPLAALRIEPVEALSAFTLLQEETGVRKDPEMMGDRGLGEFEPLRQLRDVQPLGRKNRYDLLAGRVGEGRETAPHAREVDTFKSFSLLPRYIHKCKYIVA
jgi:hypothetical protein